MVSSHSCLFYRIWDVKTGKQLSQIDAGYAVIDACIHNNTIYAARDDGLIQVPVIMSDVHQVRNIFLCYGM